MSTAKRLHYSYEQYLRLLEESDIKLEYCDGVIYAVAGGTPAHALFRHCPRSGLARAARLPDGELPAVEITRRPANRAAVGG